MIDPHTILSFSLEQQLPPSKSNAVPNRMLYVIASAHLVLARHLI